MPETTPDTSEVAGTLWVPMRVFRDERHQGEQPHGVPLLGSGKKIADFLECIAQRALARALN